MCLAMEKVMAPELEAREQIGMQKGMVRMVCIKLQKEKSVSEIAEELETTEDEISRIVEVAKRYAPEYDIEAICNDLMKSNDILTKC